MTPVRRLDHIAVVVRDTETAIGYFRDRLGLRVTSTERLEAPRVRLTYLDTGNASIQLVEPLDDASAAAAFLAEHGEGLYHLCFGVDDVPGAAATLAGPGTDAGDVTLGSGRGRPSAFVPGAPQHGTLVEVTGFDYDEDVRRSPGSLGGPNATR
jgi:methylmalonyl-CoA/ethylmalonyl-CoA epimerase